MRRWQFALVMLLVTLVSVVAHPALGVTLAATTVFTDVDEALKVLFEDPLVENIVTDSELLDLFEADFNVKSDETTGGRYIETAQMFRLPGGTGYRAEGDYIPVPNAGLVANSRIYLKKGMGTVEMSGDVMRKFKGNPGAWLDWAATELPRLVRRITNEDDRIMAGYGAGAKARVATAYNAASTTIPVDRAHGVTGLTNAYLQFLEGESLRASPNLDGTSPRTGAMIVTAINQSTGELTVDAAATSLADNDYLFQGDAAGASWQNSGDDREFMGLLGLVDDGTILSTFQNITRATYQQWQSIVIDASSVSSGVLNEDVINFADEETDLKGGGKINAFVASKSGARSFWKSLKTDRVIQTVSGAPQNGVYQGGKKGLQMLLGDRVIDVRSARKLSPEIAFGLQTNTFKRHMLNKWEWDDTTGAIWKQVTDSTGRKDAFYAYGHKYLQNSCSEPRKNFKITGITAVNS
jgi:hypothetical protein